MDPVSELPTDTIRFGSNAFGVERAFFRRITQSWAGPGWDFMISGRLREGDASLFPHGVHIEAESAPIRLEQAADYTGVKLELAGAYDEESGEPYFGLRIVETHDIADVRIQFRARDGRRYLIHLSGTVDRTALRVPTAVEALAWVEELPDHSYL